MALDRETVGLVFRLQTDAAPAQAELAKFGQFYKQTLSNVVASNQQAGQSTKAAGQDFDSLFRQLTQIRIGLTQIARGDLGGIPNLIQAYRLAGDTVADIAPKAATARQVLGLLDGQLAANGKTATTAKVLYDEFKQSLLSAAKGGSDAANLLRADFARFGIDAAQALAQPEKAFRQLFTTIGSGKADLDTLRAASNLVNAEASAMGATLKGAGAALTQYEAEAGAAAVASKGLSGGIATTTLALGGLVAATAAAAAGLVYFTLKQGEAARALELTAQTTGLSTTQLQVYERAAEAAGVKASALTDAFTKFKQQTGEGAQSFDAFLRSLEAVQTPAEKMAQITLRMGQASEDTRKAILALTENNGELRKEIEASGLVISAFEAQELAKVERRFETLSVRVEGFAKRSLLNLIDAFTEFGIALGEGGEGLVRYQTGQERAERATDAATGAIKGQTTAMNLATAAAEGLVRALNNVQFANSDISRYVNELAATSKSPQEAIKRFKDRLKFDDDFFAEFNLKQRADKIGEQLRDLINPPKGKKASFSDPNANNNLRLLRVQEQAAEREAEAEIALARRAFEQRALSIERLVQLTTEAEKKMLAAKEETFAAERAEVERSKLRATDKAAKLAEIGERELAARQKAADAIAKVEDERRKIELQVYEANIQARAERDETALKAEQDRIQQAAARRLITNENAARRIDEIERLMFDGRRERLIAEGVLANQDLVERTRINNELAKLAQERALFEEESARRRIEAQKRDLQVLREYLQERNRILQELRQAQVDALDRAARDLEQRAERSPRLRGEAEAARRIADVEAARLQNRLNLAQIEADRDAATRAATTAQQIEEIERLSNERRLAELQRYQQQRQQIEDEFARQQERENPLSARSIFGDGFADALTATESRLQAFKAMFQDWAASIKQEMAELPSLSEVAFGSITQGLAAMVEQFVLTGQTGPAALRQLTAAVLLNVAKMAAVKAVFALAEGFIQLALFNFPAAAAAFKAAALYGAVAVGAGLAGRAIAPGGAGDTFNTGQNRSPEKRVIEQGNRSRPEPQVIIIRAETEPGVSVRRVVEDYRNNGATRQLFRSDVLGEAGA